MIAEKLMVAAARLGGHVVRDLQRLVRNFKYEFDDDGGMLIANVHVRGDLDVWAPDGLGWVREHNSWITEGKTHALGVIMSGGAQKTAWYVAPFSGNVSVSTSWTYVTFASTATELTTQYSESTRQEYLEAAASAGSTNNTANPATFTAATDGVTIWGAGLVSHSAKGDATNAGHILLAASKYTTVRTLAATSDTLGIRWTISL